MMGYHDSVNYLHSNVKSGNITVTETADGWNVSGKTFEIKSYLKSNFDARWDAASKSWNIAINPCYKGGRNDSHYSDIRKACEESNPKPEPEQIEEVKPVQPSQTWESVEMGGMHCGYICKSINAVVSLDSVVNGEKIYKMVVNVNGAIKGMQFTALSDEDAHAQAENIVAKLQSVA